MIAPIANQSAGSQQPLRIVVLDDEPLIVDFIRLTLRSFFKDADIITFTSAQSGLEELKRQDPDLLTLDWNMPVISGEQVLDFLLQRGARYPIVVISGSAPDVRTELARYQAGGLEVSLVEKPFTRDELWAPLAGRFGDYAHSIAA